MVRRALIVASGVAGLALVAAVVWWWNPGVDLARWSEGPPPMRWAAWMRQERLWLGEGLDRRPVHRYVPLESIAIDVQLAVLVNEDIDFFGHGAVDPRAVREAIDEWRRGQPLRGASTISQQLARTLFLSQDRSLWRKLRELRLAWWIERTLGKRRILELYLNCVEFGPGLLGVETASRHYYGGVGADSLPPGQAAGLAACLPSPARDNPRSATDLWKFRRDNILRRMEGAGWLRRKLEELTEPPADSPTG